MKYLLLFILIAFVSSCNSGKKDSLKESSRNISELNSAPESAVIDGKTYVIEPNVWRNLMPVIDPKDKQGLLMSIKVKSKDGTSVNEKLKASTAWVVNNTDVWETPVAQTELKEQSYLEFYASKGPEWKPEQKVNVIIEIEFNGKKYLLRSKDQVIQAVH